MDYNYEEERKKLKLSPLSTCVLLFKTTVGVGIFTYQYAYARCGFILGTLLSALVFYMVIYGMYRLLELCDFIEKMEEEKITHLAKTPPTEVQIVIPCSASEVKERKGVTEEATQSGLDPIKTEDIYEIDTSTEKYQVITYHRRLFLSQRCLIGTQAN